MSQPNRGQPVPDHLSPDGRWRWDGQTWIPADDLGRLIPSPPPPPVPPRPGRLPYWGQWGKRHFTLSAWISIGLGVGLIWTAGNFFFSSPSVQAYWMVMPSLGLLAATWALARGAIVGCVIAIWVNSLASLFALIVDMQT